MRQWWIVGGAAMLLAGFTPIAGGQSLPHNDLSAFRPKTTDEKARAAVFAQKVSRPLEPNTTRVDNVEDDNFPPGPPLVYSSFLQEVVCESDAVVAGVAARKQALLTDDDSAIFTDYAVGVEEALRGIPIHKVPVIDTTLLVSLRGGSIQTRIGTFEVRDQVPLEARDRYVFFLKRIPKTSGYTMSAPQLVITRDHPEVRSRSLIPNELKGGSVSTRSLLADLREAARSCKR